MKRATIITSLATASLIALAGCGAPEAPQVTPGGTDEAQPSQVDETDELADEGLAEEGMEDEGLGSDIEGERADQNGLPVFKFGDTATYSSGKTMKVSYVEDTTLSEYGAGDCAPGDPVSVVKVVVSNESNQVWEPYMDLELSAGYLNDDSGEVEEAADVFDDYGAKSLDAGQSLPKLMPGQSGSSYWGFCHAGGEAKSLSVYGTFIDYESLDGTESVAVWADESSELLH